MDIANLKTLIAAALAESPFSISGADLSSTPIQTLLKNHLGSDSFVLSGASKAGETGNSISVKGQLTAPFLSAPNLTALAVFIVDNQQTAQVNITLTGLAAEWRLSTSLPPLKESLFDLFEYAAAQFTLDSSAPAALPKSFPVQYGFPAYTSEYEKGLIPGLSFEAKMTVKASVEGLSNLLPGNSWTFAGPVVTESGMPSVLLSSKPGTGINVAGFSIAFGLSLAAAVVASADDGSSVTCGMQLEADVLKKLASGATLDIPVYARTYTPDFSYVQISSNLSKASSILFDDIASLINGGSTNGLIPGTFPKLVDIQLDSIDVIYLPPTNTVTSVGATISFQPGKEQSWSIFDGLVVFEKLSVGFTLLPETSGVTVDVSCVALFSGGTIDASISLPGMSFVFELAEDAAPIDIGAMVKKITNGTVTMDKVTCTELKFFGTAGSFYQFRAVISDLWTFHIGSKPVEISEVGMDLTYTPSQPNPLSGQIIGTFNLAGASLYASAAYDAQSGGWIFEGGTQGEQNISITSLLNDVLSLFGLQLPANTPQIILKNLNISFNTATRQFEFLAASTFTVVSVPFELGLEVSLSQAQKRFMGYLFFGDYGFEVDYESGSQATIMKGSWQATKDQSALAISQLFTALDLRMPRLPGESILSLKAASVTYNVTKGSLLITAENLDQDKVLGAFIPGENNAATQWVLGLQLGEPINLSDLPLVGSVLSKLETISIDGLKILASGHPISTALAGEVAQLNPPAGYPVPPAKGTPAAIEINADLVMGTDRTPLNLDLGGTTKEALLPSGDVTADTAADSSTNGVWFSIQKSFGPLTLDRIGVVFSAGTGNQGATLSFAVDGSLAVAGLSITLEGASIGSTLDKFEPVFGLQGLGIAYSNPPLEIGGGFMKQNAVAPVDWEYSGIVTVQTGTVSLTAFGSYASISGQPSMFLFGQVAAPIGGPPYFFVTGFAGGFGYNSQVRIPNQNEVYQFPLVAGLTNSNVLGNNPTPLQVLAVLTSGTNPWVSPTVGSKWIAAGISFTTFEVLKTTALLMVEFGNELVVALLGLSKASFPSKGSVYAQVELQMAMVFEPSKGVFSFTAQLTPNSFLIDPKCVLTGGFAFCLWFAGSDFPGDFVVTVGGYHSLFVPPKHYPLEPRVGFEWPMDATVTISGQAYFALTPSAIMAGGALSVVFQSGNLKAWFKAWADLIIWWTPIHFNVNIGVSIGASYTLSIFGCTKTLTVELGANVVLWGPPTGGTATVYLWIFSFTIDFGAKPVTPPVASWDDVQTLLPASADALKIVAVKGLTTTEPAKAAAATGAEPEKVWIARRDTFQFSTSCAVPSSSVKAGGTEIQKSAPVNIQPMKLTGLASEHVVVITDSARQDFTSRFQASGSVGNIPMGLWGIGPNDKVNNGPQLIKDQLNGMSVQVPPPVLGKSLGAVNIAGQLSYVPLTPNGIEPLSAGEGPSGPVAQTAPDTIHTIATQIMSSDTVQARNKLYQAIADMKIAPGDNGALKTFGEKANQLFVAEPLIVPGA